MACGEGRGTHEMGSKSEFVLVSKIAVVRSVDRIATVGPKAQFHTSPGQARNERRPGFTGHDEPAGCRALHSSESDGGKACFTE